jgi:hypothetical protein
MEQQVRWLLGWLNEDEAIAALLGRAPSPGEDLGQLRRKWQEATTALLRRPPYQQPAHVLSKIPGKLKKRVSTFEQRADVVAALHGHNWTLGMIDLRSLLSLQKAVAEENVGQRAQAVVAGDVDSLFSFCLPEPGMNVKVSGTIDRANKAITFSSQNPNLRIGNPLVLDLDVPAGPGLPSRKEKYLGFTVGFGTQFVRVVECNGRCFLQDGYHRCYSLLRRSIHTIPCVFIRVSKVLEFAEIGAAVAGYLSPEILFGERPPFLVDFLDDSVTAIANRVAQRRVVRVAAAEFMVEI